MFEIKLQATESQQYIYLSDYRPPHYNKSETTVPSNVYIINELMIKSDKNICMEYKFTAPYYDGSLFDVICKIISTLNMIEVKIYHHSLTAPYHQVFEFVRFNISRDSIVLKIWYCWFIEKFKAEFINIKHEAESGKYDNEFTAIHLK